MNYYKVVQKTPFYIEAENQEEALGICQEMTQEESFEAVCINEKEFLSALGMTKEEYDRLL